MEVDTVLATIIVVRKAVGKAAAFAVYTTYYIN